jgi:hypothetical protein
MKLSVKLLAVITIFLLSATLACSQMNVVSRSSIAADILKVVEDYPNHFKNITGDLLIQNPQSSDYTCNLNIDGAEECIITKYSAEHKEICSWQALLLTTENFNEAKGKFRSLFSELNGLPVGTSLLNGKYESPAEEKNFTSVLLYVTPQNESTQKLVVEIVMESRIMEWKVKLLVYDRERDDDERGPVIEN